MLYLASYRRRPRSNCSGGGPGVFRRCFYFSAYFPIWRVRLGIEEDRTTACLHPRAVCTQRWDPKKEQKKNTISPRWVSTSMPNGRSWKTEFREEKYCISVLVKLLQYYHYNLV